MPPIIYAEEGRVPAMSSFGRRCGRGLLVVLAAAALAVAGCGSDDDESPETNADKSAQSGGGVFAAKDVEAATDGKVKSVVYDVPKELKKDYTLAFIHLDKSIPFFATWVEAMKDAADFYGVKYVDGDQQLKDEKILDVYNTLKLQNPDVIGAQHATAQLKKATDRDGVPLIGLDSSPLPGLDVLGIPDEEAGKLAGEFLAPIVKERLDGEWKGKQLYYLGMSAVPCDPCEKRVNAALEELRAQGLDIPKDRVVISRDGAATPDDNRTFATNALTAHPDGVFAIVGLNDAFALGAMQGFVSSNKTDRGVGLTLGCDETGIDALRDSKFEGLDAGCVNFNPYAEGWNWVAAAIAKAEGETYGKYEVTEVVTPETVDTVFPKSN